MELILVDLSLPEALGGSRSLRDCLCLHLTQIPEDKLPKGCWILLEYLHAQVTHYLQE
jgi:hypothetical protein